MSVFCRYFPGTMSDCPDILFAPLCDGAAMRARSPRPMRRRTKAPGTSARRPRQHIDDMERPAESNTSGANQTSTTRRHRREEQIDILYGSPLHTHPKRAQASSGSHMRSSWSS